MPAAFPLGSGRKRRGCVRALILFVFLADIPPAHTFNYTRTSPLVKGNNGRITGKREKNYINMNKNR